MMNTSIYSYIILIIAAFAINIPCGYIRERAPKYSFKWLFWIHASIPFIIFLRNKLDISGWFIPVSIFSAIVGQIVGSRIRRRMTTTNEVEKREQIPDLKIKEKIQNIPESKIMILLLNMGGPRNISEVRPFLKRLFCDELILKFPLSFFLQPIFANLIVALRGKATEHRYGLIGGGSPIHASTEAQVLALQAELNKRGHDLAVTFCFNYNYPLPQDVVPQIKAEGKSHIFPLSLYPHYSLATTGSTIHYLKKELSKTFPECQLLKPKDYYLADSYIGGLVDRIKEQISPEESLNDFYVLFSAHGLPLYFLTQGDPYPFEIAQTIAKVVDRLSLKDSWTISYQSAVGPMQWLKPSTEALIKALARRKIKKLLVVPISFVTDHIETICEIDIEYRKIAEDLGIKDFRMSRALECHPGFINALADCVELSLSRPSRTKSQDVSNVLI